MMSDQSTSLWLALLKCLYPTGERSRLSSRENLNDLRSSAGWSSTGMLTSPNVIAPFQIARGMANPSSSARTDGPHTRHHCRIALCRKFPIESDTQWSRVRFESSDGDAQPRLEANLCDN